MAASLRTRLTLIQVAANLALMGAVALWVARDELQQAAATQRRREQLLPLVGERFSMRSVTGRWEGSVADLLSWPVWEEFEDAMLIDSRVLALGGEVAPVGVFLNPLGCRRRAPEPEFPRRQITRAVTQAAGVLVGAPEAIPVANGLAVPLFTHDRRVWGGVFVVPEGAPSTVPYLVRVLLAAGLATLLSAGAIYLLLGRAVVWPVERLAQAAHDFGHGGAPQVPRGRHPAEIGELVDSFASMMERIRGFQGELEKEVAAATTRASQAERRAARGERLAALGTLAAGLAHEINSPLAGALQGLETLRREAVSERARKHGQLTAEALDRIGVLVRRLLQLAPVRVEPGRCVVQQVVADLPLFLESRLTRHRLLLDLPDADLVAAAAPGDLFPVLLNLVQNALDALDSQTPACCGTVRLSATSLVSSDAVQITVRDDGPGADAELLAHVFEPFVTGKPVGAGTGLGLALAHATVRQLGGEIEARNHPQGGLEVVLTLPQPASQPQRPRTDAGAGQP